MKHAPTADAIRAWAARRHVSASHLERWLALEDAGAAALLSIADKLHLRTGQLAAALGLLEEIALRERKTVAEILGSSDIGRIIANQDSAPARAGALLAKLRAMRYPQLAAALMRINSEIAKMKLPADLHLLLPKDLNSDEFKIELTVRSASQLEGAIRALQERRPGLTRIIELLGGGA
jgi:hypothetical protein